MSRAKQVQPPPVDARQLELPGFTRYPKPATVRVRSRNGIEDVPLTEMRDWLAKHADRVKSGA